MNYLSFGAGVNSTALYLLLEDLNIDFEEDQDEEEDPKDKPEKRRRDGMGRFKKKEAEG